MPQFSTTAIWTALFPIAAEVWAQDSGNLFDLEPVNTAGVLARARFRCVPSLQTTPTTTHMPACAAARSVLGMASRSPAALAVGSLLAIGLLGASLAEASDTPSDTWIAVAVSTSAWGTAASPNLSAAIAGAVHDCKSRSPLISDCGAEIKTIKAGYILASRCGRYRILVSGDSLEGAEDAHAHRILQLRYISNAALGPCTRILQLQVPDPLREAQVSDASRR